MKKIIFSVFFLISTIASADLSRSTLFSLNTIYLDREYVDNNVTTKNKITDTDLRLMRIEKKWAYGVIYSQSASDSSDASRTSYGVSTGYYSDKDFYINLHYFFGSKYTFGNTEYSKGSGYELDLGFVTKITSSFYAGLMFGRKEFKYSESTTNLGFPGGTTTSEASSTHRELIPMFTFAVVFQ
jgi:hypothetical protein